MQRLFLAIFGVLALLSLVAVRMQPPPDDKLTWVSDDNPRRKEQVELFEAEERAGHISHDGRGARGLKLDPNNSGMEKVIVQSLGGVGSPLFDCYDGNQLAAYVRSGVALDITDQLAARGLSLAAVWPGVRPLVEYNGRIYGWPTNAAVDALFINRDIFKAAGEPLPPSGPIRWSEFLPIAKRLTRRSADGHVIQYGFLADWTALWKGCLLQWGGRFYTADGRRSAIDSPQAIAAVQFAHDLIYKHHIMPTPVEEASLSGQGGWGQGTIKWFGAAKGACALGGRWWLCSIRDQTHPEPGHGPPLRLAVRECPYGPAHVFRAYGRATLVNATSPQRDRAVDFMVYMSQKPYNDLINAQADALGPVKQFCSGPTFDHNPAYPEEDYNEVWRRVMNAGVPEQTSPYVDGQAVNTILDKQLDLIKSDQKLVPDALHDAARKINAEIDRLVAEDPQLRARYSAAAPSGAQ